MRKEILLLGFVGMFVGWIFLRLLIYFLMANGIKTDWMVHHHLLINLASSLLFGIGAVLYTVLRKK